MNNWEKCQKQDADYKWDCSTKTDWLVKYEIDSHYWANGIQKLSKWQVFKMTAKRYLRAIFITPFAQLRDGITCLVSRRCKYNEADIEQYKHEIKMAYARIDVLEWKNKDLIDHANRAWDTLAAYRKLDEDAAEEQAKKKAAKKRPSSRKKR